jgi:serine/threonine protein phosphatase PrpC
VAARSDVGLVRRHNEDAFLLADLSTGARQANQLSRVGPAGVLFGVCDGVGGRAAGEVASHLAVSEIVTRMQRLPAEVPHDVFARALVHSIELASAAIQGNAKLHPERAGMGSTATVAAIRKDRLFVGQVGDSRAYLLRAGELVQLTKDQSLANQLIEIGKLSAKEAGNSPASNVILQALGAVDRLWVDITSVELRRGDRLLLCSDGLTGPVGDEAIRRTLFAHRDLDICAEQLIAHAKAGGGRDNITVVLCELDGDGLEPPAAGELPRGEPYSLARATQAHEELLAVLAGPVEPSTRMPEPERDSSLAIPGLRRLEPVWLSVALAAVALAVGYWHWTHEDSSTALPAARARQTAPGRAELPHVTVTQLAAPTGQPLAETRSGNASGWLQELVEAERPPLPPAPPPRERADAAHSEGGLPAAPRAPQADAHGPTKWKPPAPQRAPF